MIIKGIKDMRKHLHSLFLPKNTQAIFRTPTKIDIETEDLFRSRSKAIFILGEGIMILYLNSKVLNSLSEAVNLWQHLTNFYFVFLFAIQWRF